MLFRLPRPASYQCQEAAIEAAAAAVDVELRNVRARRGRRGVFFTLAPQRPELRYMRRSASGWGGEHRRVFAVCWHGHRDFLRALLNIWPAGTIITCRARYDGLAHFEESHRSTARANIGSEMAPVAYSDACDCEEGSFVRALPSPLVDDDRLPLVKDARCPLPLAALLRELAR